MAKKQSKPKPPLLSVVQSAIAEGIDSVIVGVSGGMDSVAALDLCRQHFKRVAAYNMYLVPGLSFQDRYLSYLEKRYSITIERLPHWVLSRMYRTCVFRHPTSQSAQTPRLSVSDIDAYVRQKFGIEFIATGEKYSDSIERNTQIVQCNGINHTRKRIYPLAWFKHEDVQHHLARQSIMLPPDYRLVLEKSHRGNFGGLISFRELIPIRDNYPQDYEKICRYFPLAPAQLQRYEQLQERERNNPHIE